MKITTRRGAVAFFIALGCGLVAITIGLNVTWLIHWRNIVPAVIGIVLFALIIAGLIVNTIFVVREIRRNEQYDSFLNAVTHELRTPVASIRLYAVSATGLRWISRSCCASVRSWRVLATSFRRVR